MEGDGNGRAIRRDRGAGEGVGPEVLGKARSGRRFVVLAVLSVLAIWGSLYVAFRIWRDGYRERIAFARGQVLPAIDGLARLSPDGVSESEWKGMVGQTRAMLDRLIGADRLDRAGAIALRDDLAGRVARARPDSTVDMLYLIWADMQARAGPAIAGAERPERFGLALVVEALMRQPPPGIDRAAWSEATLHTRRLLMDLARSGRLDPGREAGFRLRWTSLVDEALARPDRAKDALRQVWLDVEAEPLSFHRPRPDLLADP